MQNQSHGGGAACAQNAEAPKARKAELNAPCAEDMCDSQNRSLRSWSGGGGDNWEAEGVRLPRDRRAPQLCVSARTQIRKPGPLWRKRCAVPETSEVAAEAPSISRRNVPVSLVSDARASSTRFAGFTRRCALPGLRAAAVTSIAVSLRGGPVLAGCAVAAPPRETAQWSLWATVCPADSPSCSTPSDCGPQARNIPEIIGSVHFPSTLALARPQKRESPCPPTGLFGLEGGSALRPRSAPGIPCFRPRPLLCGHFQERAGHGWGETAPSPESGAFINSAGGSHRKPSPGGKPHRDAAPRHGGRSRFRWGAPQMPDVHSPHVWGEGATHGWWTWKLGSCRLGSECPLAQCLRSRWGRGRSLCGASCSRREQTVFTTWAQHGTDSMSRPPTVFAVPT